MEKIRTLRIGNVLRIIFNRPEKKNALTEEMYLALNDALDQAILAPEVKVIVFSGEGGIFTAGNDLDDFVKNPPKDLNSPVFAFLRRLTDSPKPVIAAVEGVAIGLGTSMLFHCDLVYASENAKFGLPFVTLGLVPEGGSSLILPRCIGHQRASEKLFFGEPFDANDGLSAGFVNQILPIGQVIKTAMAQAERLAALPTSSVISTKRLLRGWLPQGLAASEHLELTARMEAEIEEFCDHLALPAFQEAVSAFREKRKADFSHCE